MPFDPLSTRASRRQLLKASGIAVATLPVLTLAPRLATFAQEATPASGGATAAVSASPSASPMAATGGDWPSFGYDFAQTRHVPFNLITKDNVADLGIAWQVDFQKVDKTILPGNQCFPIIVDGIAYVTTTYSNVFAIDVKTGTVKWQWKPENVGFFKNFGVSSNRGVAVGEGKVFVMSLDMHIYAIDQQTGKLVNDLKIWDIVPEAKPEFGYYESSAPVYYNGNVYFGVSGSDNGVRGFFMAAKAADLSPAWPDPFWTIPPDGQDWRKEGSNHGGGAPWMPGTIDTETNTLYFVTGNPSPDFFGEVRPGNNPNTNSIVAANAASGAQIWVAQTIGHDLWDYDMAAPPVLFMATIDGKQVKVVAEGSKGGQWWAWDASNGKVIYDGVPFSKIDHPDPTEKGVLVYPGVLGGSNYSPQGYDPTTNYYLITEIEYPVLLKKASAATTERRGKGDVDFGGTFTYSPDIPPKGHVVAINMASGEIVYSKDEPSMLRSGITTTESGLGFYGGTSSTNANAKAIDTKTGKELWSFGVGNDVSAAPSFCLVDGEQYMIQTVGGTGSKVIAFKLGGDKKQIAAPPPPAKASQVAPKNPDDFFLINPNKEKSFIGNLVCGFSDANSGLNFNGWSKGDATVTVPTGWEFVLNFFNPTAMAHSAMICEETELKKSGDYVEAFQGAFTPNPVTGYTGNQVQTWVDVYGYIRLSVAGDYVVLCAVPGHASSGMWFKLAVKDDATTVTITTPEGTKNAKTQA